MLSGLVCGLIIFVFCAVYSSMIFQQAGMPPQLLAAAPIGVDMHAMSVLVGSVMFARFSGCKAVMGGPDITPVVFIAEATASIVEAMCPGGTCPASMESKVVPTVLAGCWVATLLIGVCFVLLGAFRMTGFVGFVPANVTAGFLSCIGWKVFKASFEVATGSPLKFFEPDAYYLRKLFGGWHQSWKLIVPGLPVGFLLYFVKRLHLASPSLSFPVLILVPTALFYIIVFASGFDVEEMRRQKWFYPATSSFTFDELWEVGYGGALSGRVEWDALAPALPSWLIMIFIVCLDNVLKLSSTETALKIDFNYNREMKIGGWASILTGLLFGSPVYGQTKFDVLNYSFTGRTDSPTAAYVCAAFMAACFFADLPLTNFLPRFLLAGLLVFSGAGFLVENLWDARKKYDRFAYFTIWAVFLTFFFAGELLPQFGLLFAIVVGIAISTLSFALKFAKKSKLHDAISGYDYSSTAVRSAAQEMKLGVLGCWYHIFRLDGYIFFGTSATLYKRFKDHVDALVKIPRCERSKYIIFDMSEVDEADETALDVFSKILRLAQSSNIELVWCGLGPLLQKNFRVHGILTEESDGGSGGHGGHGGHGGQ